jgi:hypothetical protein
MPLHDVPEADGVGLLDNGKLASNGISNGWRGADLRASTVLSELWFAAVFPSDEVVEIFLGTLDAAPNGIA